MTELSNTFRRIDDASVRFAEYEFYCPGCDEVHSFRVLKSGAEPIKGVPVWTYNHNFESPTFIPSLLYDRPGQKHCHLHLTNGKIQYEPDCGHDFAGKTIEMRELP